MKSSKNRSERAEELAVTNDTTKTVTELPKKKKKKKNLDAKADKDLTTANVAKAAKDEVTDRVTKYHYPAEVKTTKDKKDFRRKARAKIAEFTKKITKLTKSTDEGDKKALKATQAEFDAWKEKNLNPAQ